MMQSLTDLLEFLKDLHAETARRRAIGILDAIRETLNGAPLVEMRALSTTGPKG